MSELGRRRSDQRGRPSRIGRKADFTRTLTKGVRVSVRDMAVHIAPVPQRWPDPTGMRTSIAEQGGPWLGLIISRKVGNSVVRHALARRLRAAFAATSGEFAIDETYVVVRAYPGLANSSTAQLEAGLRRAFAHPRARGAFEAAAADSPGWSLNHSHTGSLDPMRSGVMS